MDKSTGAPKPPKAKKTIATLVGFTAIILSVILTTPAWAQNLLIIIGIAGFGCEALLAMQHDKAHKAWLKTQPASVDPLQGAPDLPHLKQGIALAIGFSAFGSLGYFGLPLRDTGFSSNDWWFLILILIMFAGFGYASRIQKKHNKAFMAWSHSQSPPM